MKFDKKHMNRLVTLLCLCATFFLLKLSAQEVNSVLKQDIELGKVSWLRNYEEAVTLSEKKNKPILILFQEVPGCSTCRNYGKNVLSHPLMVESIENLFVPLVIHNNKGGTDKKILEKFSEPTWNNPVVRIVDENGEDQVTRVNRDYSAKGLYDAMKNALENYTRNIKSESDYKFPEYFKILGQELKINNEVEVDQTYFKMYCFWSGERHLGSLDGVLTTEAGFMSGHEVVKVQYDPELISKTDLTAFAQEGKCSSISENDNYKIAQKDLKYSLQQTNYRNIPLSPIQQTKINSALSSNLEPNIYLSPKQKLWIKEINEGEADKIDFLYKEFESAWMEKLQQ